MGRQRRRPVKNPVVKGGDWTKADIDHAADDAQMLVANSRTLQACVAVDIISRRLYMAVRQTMAAHIAEDWDVTNEALVIQVLVMSAQERANDKFSMLSLQQELFQTAIPFMDILVRMEGEHAQAAAEAAAQESAEEPPATETEAAKESDDVASTEE